MKNDMKFDFDKITERRGTSSLKWDVRDNELPMWVADMDFPTAPDIISALKDRVTHGVFGYNVLPEEWAPSIVRWWKDRHGFEMEADRLCFCTGVVPAISCLVKRYTNHGDRVVVMTPAYDIFYHSIENAGRQVYESPLGYDGKKYEIDFADLEEKLSHPQSTLLILCNPHNPTGNIWTAEQLAAVGEMCSNNGVTVISDEIHCDLTDPGYGYTPFASVSDTCANISVTCISASKAFNIAGLQSAAVYSRSKKLFEIAVRGLNSDELAEPNTFAAIATATAFGKCGDWLDELRGYLTENKRYAEQYIRCYIPEVHCVMSHATYLLWLDVTKITEDSDELASYIRNATGLYLSSGGQYRGNGKSFLRMNVACPRSVLERGLELLRRGIGSYGDAL